MSQRLLYTARPSFHQVFCCALAMELGCLPIAFSNARAQTFTPQQAISTELCSKFLGVNSCETIRTDRVHRNFTQAKLDRALFAKSGATASHCTRLTADEAQCAQSISITTDPVWNRIVWGHSNSFIKAFGSPGTGSNQFLNPRGVAITRRSGDAHAVFVADAANNRVVVLVVNHVNREIDWRGTIDGSESGKKLRMPNDVAYSHTGTWAMTDDRLFILDTGNDRVLVYQITVNMQGSDWPYRYLGQFGTSGSAENQLWRPSSISVMQLDMFSAYVVIADEGNKRLSRWSFDSFNPPEFPPALGVRVSATYPTAAFSSVTHDGEGSWYAADRSGHRLLKFDYDLREIKAYGNNMQMWSLGNFNSPSDVEVVRSYTQDPTHGTLVTTSLPYLKTTEAWTATTGMQLHRLGVDADGLSVTLPAGPTGREATATFLMTANAQYRAKVLPGYGGTPIRTWPLQASVAGWRSVYWDGRNDAGTLMGAGAYQFSIEYLGGYSDDVWRTVAIGFQFRDPPQPLTASIDGPSVIQAGPTGGTWTALASGGWQPYGFQGWRTNNDGSPGESFQSSYSGGTYACDGFTISFQVTSTDGQVVDVAMPVSVSEDPDGFACVMQSTVLAEVPDAPSEFSLSQDYAAPAPGFHLSQMGLRRVGASESPGNANSQRSSQAAYMRAHGITAIRFGVPRPPVTSSVQAGFGRSKSPPAASTAVLSASGGSKRVVIRIFNVRGMLVHTAVNETLEPGFYRYEWDGRTDAGAIAAPGVYVAVMASERFTKSTKLVRVR